MIKRTWVRALGRSSAPSRVRNSARTLTTPPSETPVRWLGVYFDTKLTFRHHVETWAAKAAKVANHIRSLNKVLKGAPPAPTALAAAACVLPVALYRAETWWRGQTVRNAKYPDKVAVSGQVVLADKIDKAIVTAARAVLPAWKTIPTAILHRESGLASALFQLDNIRYRMSFRMRTLHEAHPLTQRLNRPDKPRGKGGRPAVNGPCPARTTT